VRLIYLEWLEVDGDCSGAGAGDGLVGMMSGDVSVPVSESVALSLSGSVA